MARGRAESAGGTGLVGEADAMILGKQAGRQGGPGGKVAVVIRPDDRRQHRAIAQRAELRHDAGLQGSSGIAPCQAVDPDDDQARIAINHGTNNVERCVDHAGAP